MDTQIIEKAIEIAGGQSSLAKACGVTQPAVHKWLNGKSRPCGVKARLISEFTGGQVSVHDLRPDIFGPPPSEAA